MIQSLYYFSFGFLLYYTKKIDPILLYDETTQFILQLFNGDHFLSQGGTERIEMMIKGENLYNKKILDFGSGLGTFLLFKSKI